MTNLMQKPNTTRVEFYRLVFARRRAAIARWALGGLTLAAFACTYDYDKFQHDSTDSAGKPAASGGASSTEAQGGSTATDGGSPTSTGGNANSTGGTESTGGTSSADASGGAADAGDAGGAANPSGGMQATGGMDTGGRPATGGSAATGGNQATGGTSSAPITSCDSPLTLCSSSCFNLQSDASHCGQCNVNCTSIGATFACYSGTCGCSLPSSCGSGTVNCVNHLCVCGTSTSPCSVGQICVKKGTTYSCGAP